MGRNLILGDVHGRIKALSDVLGKMDFNPDEDTLYAVGDYIDRGESSLSVLRYLSSLPHFKGVIGNHDIFLESWLYSGKADDEWLDEYDGKKTEKEFDKTKKKEKRKIALFLKRLPIALFEEKYIVVHSGPPAGRNEADMRLYSKVVRPEVYDKNGIYPDITPLVDRSYFLSAYSKMDTSFRKGTYPVVPPLDTGKRIFVGHTPIPSAVPFISEEYHLVALDTGAGHDERLTLMDMDTLEYVQSNR